MQPFLDAGGALSHLLLESVFSRTVAACGKTQSHNETAAELAAYAAALQAGKIGGGVSPPTFFLYDALPHYRVGDAWPANTAGAHYDLELGAVLSALRQALYIGLCPVRAC